jgi:hypothetical protein
MKVKTLLAAWLVAMMATGCQTFQAIDETAGAWAREIKADRAVASGNESGHEAQCAQPINEAIPVATDVDTAYARLKRYLGYRTDAERGVDQGFESTVAGVRHQALPGSDTAWRTTCGCRIAGHLGAAGWLRISNVMGEARWSACAIASAVE